VPTGSELAYLDASALVKLVLEEPESEALRGALPAWPRRTTSRLAVVELVRSIRRVDPRLEPLAWKALGGVDLLEDSDRILAAAAQLDPPEVRAFDAIHIASTLGIRPVLTAFVSYDRRQLDAAIAAELPTVSPRS
jgi:predicted nucleic acid-binding protein